MDSGSGLQKQEHVRDAQQHKCRRRLTGTLAGAYLPQLTKCIRDESQDHDNIVDVQTPGLVVPAQMTRRLNIRTMLSIKERPIVQSSTPPTTLLRRGLGGMSVRIDWILRDEPRQSVTAP